MVKGSYFTVKMGNGTMEVQLQNVDWGNEIIAALPANREDACRFGRYGKYFLRLSPEEQEKKLDEYYS